MCISALDAYRALNMGGIYMSKVLFINEIGVARHIHHFAVLESVLLITDRVRGSDLLIFQRPSGIRGDPGRQ